MQVILRESTDLASGPVNRMGSVSSFAGNLVETNRRFEHEQHVEAVLTDVLHHPGYLLTLDDRLMNGLAELLNEFTQAGCHGYLQKRRPTRAKGAGCGMESLYLNSIPV